MFIMTLMTSVALTAIFCASSPTVMASPIATSRTTRAVGISKPCLVSASPAHGAAPSVARFLLLVARAHVADDVQFLAAVAGGLVVDHLARRLAGLGRRGLALAFRHFARLHLGGAARLLLGGALAVFLVAAAPALLLQPLAVEALLLEPLAFRALDRRLGLLLGFAQLVDLFLLMARLILEHLALDVGALAAHLDVDGARAALRARELQFGLGLAPQRDLARGRIGLQVIVAVAAAQMRQQLVLRVLADHVLGAVDLDAGLIELLQQPSTGTFSTSANCATVTSAIVCS